MKKFTFLLSLLLSFAWQGANSQTFNSGACPKSISIPDSNPTGVNDTIVVSGVGNSLGSNVVLESVTLHLSHTWSSDLDVFLTSPNGVTVELVTDAGGSGRQYGDDCNNMTTFNMSASSLITSGTGNFVGSFLPEGNLADFNDASDANGNWVLNVSDDAGGDVGNIEFVELFFALPPTCPNPSSLASSNLTGVSVDLGWTENGTATMWDIEWDTTGFTPGSGNMITGTTTNPHNLTGLSPQTTYEFYVRADCGGSTSNWVGPFSFTTLCASYTPNYLQDFTTFVPNCWDEASDGTPGTGYTGAGTGEWNHTSFLNAGGANNATKINLYNLGTNDWLLSPMFDLSAGGWELAINAGVTTYNGTGAINMGSDDVVQVLISTDGGVNWSVIYTWDVNNQPNNLGALYTIDLSAYTGTNNQFAIWASEGTVDDPQDFDFHINDFEIRIPLACPSPSPLTATNIDGFSADLGWTENGTATTWDIEWDTTGFTPGLGNMIAGTTTNPHNLTGLTPETSYDFYVRADCGGSYSTWTGPFTFMTTVSCQAPSNINTLAINPNDALIGWTENGSATSWQVEWGNAGFTLGAGNSQVTSTNPYLTAPLTPDSPYDFYVRAICGAGDTSAWVGPFMFMTPCVAPTISSFPWTENFDGETTPNMPCGWVVDNVNADTYTWETGTNSPNSGANAMQIRWNSVEAANDWAFTPELSLTGGMTYQLSFAYKAQSATYTEKLKVMYGAGQNVAGMTDLLFDTTFNHIVYDTAMVMITPATTGSYYIGFHNYSEADMFRVYVDDVTLDIATSIANNVVTNEVSIFPNPSTGVFTIAGSIKNANVSVMSITGETVYQNTITGNNTTIDLSNKSKGLYFVSISTENGKETYKVIIQ